MKKIQVTYKIYEYRTKKNMSVRELSELSGVSKSQINRIENNLTHPTVNTLCQIAYALNVQPVRLFVVSHICEKF